MSNGTLEIDINPPLEFEWSAGVATQWWTLSIDDKDIRQRSISKIKFEYTDAWSPDEKTIKQVFITSQQYGEERLIDLRVANTLLTKLQNSQQHKISYHINGKKMQHNNLELESVINGIQAHIEYAAGAICDM